jgi:alkylation response protein AidB-like acyl-CoA dehydrogenase
MLTEDYKLASFCLTEPDAGSDVSGMRTTAVRKGDKYVINGSKCFITNGGYADWYTVYAKTDKEAATAASPASSSPVTTRSRWTRRRTRWASGRPTPRPSRSTRPRSPSTT